MTRAIQHIAATAQYSIYYGEGRDAYDLRGRTAHESIFNLNDGNYRCPNSQQGFSGFTTWTRGLAWAITGYAEQLEFFDTLSDQEINACDSRAKKGGRGAGERGGRGVGPGRKWLADRFRHPYLRDSLLDIGIATDTVETATTWSNLEKLATGVRAAIREALAGEDEAVAVLCHLSHPYPDGASLYFTFFYRRPTDVDSALARWRLVRHR
ncbi:FAD-linked oxidase C-terminal domain-containing protein [Alteromonas abrolhosensis]|uniref:FAD-linked oxidase C-terminal domain-containing protein n=1 Tax=Alteromonas abrolhosensis TaxID=1892904 RepID=UPI003BA850EF